jgi:hypothetical protein
MLKTQVDKILETRIRPIVIEMRDLTLANFILGMQEHAQATSTRGFDQDAVLHRLGDRPSLDCYGFLRR